MVDVFFVLASPPPLSPALFYVLFRSSIAADGHHDLAFDLDDSAVTHFQTLFNVTQASNRRHLEKSGVSEYIQHQTSPNPENPQATLK